MKRNLLILSALLIGTLAIAAPLEQTIDANSPTLEQHDFPTSPKLADVLVRKDPVMDSPNKDTVDEAVNTIEKRIVDNLFYALGNGVGFFENGIYKIFDDSLNGWRWVLCTPGYNCPSTCRHGNSQCVRYYRTAK